MAFFCVINSNTKCFYWPADVAAERQNFIPSDVGPPSYL
jgi:hypothetical protein